MGLVEPFEIVRVVDTRAYVEEGDRWIPVAGSGDAHECERCGRRHEVHAHVVDATGRGALVGVGCAVADAPVARRLSSGAARDARNAAKEAAASGAAETLRAAVASLPEFPADRVVVERDESDAFGHRWSVDDVKCYGRDYHDDGERRSCLRRNWLARRLVDAVGGSEEHRRLVRLAGFGSWSDL